MRAIIRADARERHRSPGHLAMGCGGMVRIANKTDAASRIGLEAGYAA
jgi:hypothetical protein